VSGISVLPCLMFPGDLVEGVPCAGIHQRIPALIADSIRDHFVDKQFPQTVDLQSDSQAISRYSGLHNPELT